MKKYFLVVCIIIISVLSGCGSKKAEIRESNNTIYDSIATTIHSAESKSEMDSICDLIKLAVGNSFTYYDIYYSDGYFIVLIAHEGFADNVIKAKEIGLDENSEIWSDMIETFMDAYEAHIKLLDSLGVEDCEVLLNVVNDYNYDNVLVSIAYGEIIYDCMAE